MTIKGLDRYLTTEPVDNFTPYVEQIVDKFSDDFYYENQNWLDEYTGQFNKWCNRIFDRKDWSPEQAAKIIERTKRLYKV